MVDESAHHHPEARAACRGEPGKPRSVINHGGDRAEDVPIPMKIDTRPATSQDVDWLANLFIQSMRDAITATRGFWDRAREDAQFRAQLQITDARVIWADGEEVGFITVRRSDDRLIEVHTLCIKPDRQGMGIGTNVMRGIMVAARTKGLAVELSVLRSNGRAERLYSRLGFAKISASAHHFRMRWPVAPSSRTEPQICNGSSK